MKNILLVYPEYPVTYWGLQHSLKFVNKKSMNPPLGLLTVAAILPQDYNVRLIDMQVSNLTDENILWADIVFISAMIVQKESFRNVAETCRRLGKPVAAGGPYPTSSYQSIEGVDYFILGEGENTIPAFIRDYENGTPEKIYRAEEKPDIRTSPVPRYDLINIDDYRNLAIQFSRGCPFSCEFCDVIEMFGRRPRIKTVEQVLNELNCIYDTGFRGAINIVDDNFIGSKNEALVLLKTMRDWQTARSFPFSFYTQTSINLAAETGLLDLMVECGFVMVFIGIETPDEKALLLSNKNQNVKQDLLESAKIIQAKGIEIMSGFIIGFDTDTEDIFDRQISFIQEAAIPLAMVGLLLALPGTQLSRRLQKEGRLLYETSGNNTNELELNFIPVMDRDNIFEGYARVLKTIYSPGKYFERTITLLSRMPDKPYPDHIYKHKKVPKGTFQALFRSLVFQGFSWYGLSYFRFLVKAFILHRSNFATAMSFAIIGHHFFVITKKLSAEYENTGREK